MFGALKDKLKNFIKKESEVLEQSKIKTAEIEKTKQDEKFKAKITLKTKLKQKVSRKAEIKKEDIESLLFDFQLALLEADVSVSVAEKICSEVEEELVGKETSSEVKITSLVEKALKKALNKIIKEPDFEIEEKIKEKKPFVILFIGPNGHGKSTTIGKLASYLKNKNISCVVSASDTFRAAAIEQISKIGEKAEVKVIKQAYGADPVAVAFDAIKHAKSKNTDVVLIDTAGRSELNKNLMQEIEKMKRVAKPDFVIYIGEALAGNAAVEEAKKFNEFVSIDGIIMSKADCDVKGGSILSISHEIGKPILFLGIGQELSDLKKFSKEWFINKIFD